MPIEDKIKKSRQVIEDALNKYDKCAVAFTGGKDSTLLVWFVKQVCEEKGFDMPPAMFINEGDVFEEVWEFVYKLRDEWNLDLRVVQNDDVLKQVKKLGDPVKVALLNKVNREELKKIGFDGKEFPFEPESFVGNHLMKTVAMKNFLRENKIQALFTGIRWDEQEARRDEVYFSPRQEPPHVRVHPLLHFREKDVWAVIRTHGIPVNKLYSLGYRSLGAKSSTTKPDDKPAWEQDFEKVPERSGRRQDKEEIMKRLRDLGYM